MSTIAVKKVKLGDNADPSKNFLIEVPAIADGTLTIKRENGTNVLSIDATGKAAIPGVVGTVAQVGGVPTGQVVERGSNANGDYIRFADGTQICTGGTTLPAASNSWTGIYASDGATLTFPAAFSTLPAISSGTQARSVGDGWTLSGWLTTTECVFFTASGTQGAILTISYTAIGRWF